MIFWRIIIIIIISQDLRLLRLFVGIIRTRETYASRMRGDIDIMYNFLPLSEGKELYRRAFHKDFNPPPLFSTIQIPKPKRGNATDRRGFNL
jgi:hypothetical protein